MKIFKRLLLCTLALTLFVAACGCDRIVGLRGEQVSSSSSFDSRFDKTPDMGMSPYDVYSFFENAYLAQCYLMNFCAGSGTEYYKDDTVKLDNGLTYARCNTGMFTTQKEFEDLLKLFFDGEFLEKLQENAAIGDEYPKYKDFNGVAYVCLDQLGEKMTFNLDLSTFEIVENTTDCIKFTVEGDYSYGETEQRSLNKIILDKINNNWRTTYWMVEDINESSSGNGSSSAESSSAQSE